MIYFYCYSTVLLELLAMHFLCDYPLQGEFLAQAKNRNTPLGKIFWPRALIAHSVIHGGAVLLVTGSLLCAVCEVVIHAVTDYLKCESKISINADQAIHVACKLAWAAYFLLLIR